MSLGPLTFLGPLTLLGLLALPFIWWLLKVTPPTPKDQTFPPLRILRDVMTEEETPNSTPLWLLIFRLLLIALICVALARPILFKPEGVTDRPLTLVIDNGWSGAANWNMISGEAENRIVDARRKNVPVLLATTVPDDTPLEFVQAEDALRRIKSLRPTPLPADHAALSETLSKIDISNSDAIWLSGGLNFGSADQLGETLKRSKAVERLSPNTEALAIFPGETEETANGFRSMWHRSDNTSLLAHEIIATGRDGRIVARASINFAPGNDTAEATFEIPAELRSRITALRVDGMTSAGAVKLLDDSWGRPLIGILTPDTDNSSPLLSEPFYAETALGPYADVFTGSIDELLPLAPSIIVMPDEARTDSDDLKEFVENGGLLIRFAGPKLAKRPDNLLPVKLRAGGRELGGALTWEDPQRLDAFPENSPFFGLSISDDITVKRQIMAEPGAETDTRTWARLEDGSPIVTSAPLGFGRIILFHVTAGPEWSNLPVGGLYVDMLRRLLSLARSGPTTETVGSGDWAPERVLNGFGRLTTASIDARPIPHETFDDTLISLEHPPGLYRQGPRRKALNTIRAPETIKAIGSQSGISVGSYGQTKQRTLAGTLLGLALGLLALDVLFALMVSGRLAYLKPRKGVALAATLVFATLFMISTSSYAQDDIGRSDALELHLAYVETGNSRKDALSEAAMEGLVDALTRRTTIEPSGVRGINPETDSLLFYPFLYWPVTRDAPALSEKAAANLNDFMSSGGTIIFDTQDAGDRAILNTTTHPGLSRITESLDIPSLTQVPEDHVLTKSFYLLQVFPGRWANGPVWVDRNMNGAAKDGVSSVIIGGNDWAAGWALDDNQEPLQDLERDIPRQREMSMRFGVNVAMYALAGNYKSDQVHAAALIERLGKANRVPENLGRDDEDNP